MGRLLVCLGALVCSAPTLSAQTPNRVNCGGRFGVVAVNEYFQNCGFLIQNQGGTSLTFQFCTEAGANTTTPVTWEITPSMSGNWYFEENSVSTSSITISAGQTIFARFGDLQVRVPSAGDLGVHNAVPGFYYKKDGIVNHAVLGYREVNFVGTGTSTTYATAQGLATVAAGLSKVGGGVTAGNECNFGILALGAVPPLGRITVNGLVGNYTGQMFIGGELLDSEVQNPQPPNPTLPGPLWEWETLTPAEFDGQSLEIRVNDRIVWTQTIVGDANDNFLIELVFDPNNPEYLQPFHAPDGTPLPDPGDDVTNNPPDTPADPGPIPGTNPATDTTPQSSMTVMDHYRAVRKAIQDSLNSPTPRFNANEWMGNDSLAGDARGNAAGAGIGEAASSLASGIAGIPSMPVPGLNGAAPLTFTIWGHIITLGVTPYAPIFRGFLLLILVITFWICAVKLVRGAFATST